MIKHYANYSGLFLLLLIGGLFVLLFTTCSSDKNGSNRLDPSATAQAKTASQQPSSTHGPSVEEPTVTSQKGPNGLVPTVTFILQTGIAEGRLAFIGKGGTIDGKSNPDLEVKSGDVVQVILINGEGAEHDITFPDFNATSDHV
ncbi:MAG: hypothetical protein ACM3SR_02130, partial [Ignavibacteriales bacterium]